MRKIPTRQVHLDFHTSPLIPGIGEKFDKSQFQAALKEGHINSITIFAKCHHGVCYYPTKVGTPHPGLRENFDLTGAMMDAAHEIGVAAPVYITVGWSAQDAREHPEWRACHRDGKPQLTNVDYAAAPDSPRPDCSWENMCPSGDYADHIYALTREVCDRYEHLDGLFYDIVYIGDVCYCENCMKGMKECGLDPDNLDDAKAYFRRLHIDFAANCRKILHEKHPDATIFFNSGGAEIYMPEYHDSQTHFEMEDLPTVWGGYDKMVPRASVMARYGKSYLGMTGKFHTSWGEFGGYKSPDALTYEVLMMGMFGAYCSVGDHMPPSGRMDKTTYRLIGKAYETLEKLEPVFYPAAPTGNIGVYLAGEDHWASDEGLHKMLLESHLDFKIVLPGDPLDRFATLILPDFVTLPDSEYARIRTFADQGGAVLLSNLSALKDDVFQISCGVEYEGKAPYSLDYLSPADERIMPFTGDAPFLCYEGASVTRMQEGASALAKVCLPWFERTYATYCGHKNAPYSDEAAAHPGIVQSGKVIYIAHPLCKLYCEYGAQVFRDVLINCLHLIHTPVYTVKGLPSAGRTRLTHQQAQNRYVFHLSYASPIQRGICSVIEDLPAIDGVTASIKMDVPVNSITSVTDPALSIPFMQEDGTLTFSVPKFTMYTGFAINC